MPVSLSFLARSWDEGGLQCRMQRCRAEPESIAGKRQWILKRHIFAPTLRWSNSQFVIVKDVPRSFWEQWKFAKWLRVSVLQPPFCLPCAVAKLEYRNTSSRVSTHIWHVPHRSSGDQGDVDDFSPGQEVFGHLKSALSHDISWCGHRGVGSGLAAGSAGYVRGGIIESFFFFLQSNSFTFTTWAEVVSAGEAAFTDKSICNGGFEWNLRCVERKECVCDN